MSEIKNKQAKDKKYIKKDCLSGDSPLKAIRIYNGNKFYLQLKIIISLKTSF